MKISQFFVAFSENVNFNDLQLENFSLPFWSENNSFLNFLSNWLIMHYFDISETKCQNQIAHNLWNFHDVSEMAFINHKMLEKITFWDLSQIFIF